MYRGFRENRDRGFRENRDTGNKGTDRGREKKIGSEDITKSLASNTKYERLGKNATEYVLGPKIRRPTRSSSEIGTRNDRLPISGKVNDRLPISGTRKGLFGDSGANKATQRLWSPNDTIPTDKRAEMTPDDWALLKAMEHRIKDMEHRDKAMEHRENYDTIMKLLNDAASSGQDSSTVISGKRGDGMDSNEPVTYHLENGKSLEVGFVHNRQIESALERLRDREREKAAADGPIPEDWR